MQEPLVVVDLPVIDAALLPIVQSVLADMKRGKLEALEDREVQDEGIAVLVAMLQPLIEFAVQHTMLKDINEAEIPFAGKPEVDCLSAKKLRGSFGNVFSIDSKTRFQAVKVLTMRNHSPGEDGQRTAFLGEVEMGRKAHKLGVGPNVIDAFVWRYDRTS